MLNAEEIYKILLTAYGKPRWWSDDPFTVMFQSVLVQNTAWDSVKKMYTHWEYITAITLTAGKYKASLCRIYGKSFYLSGKIGKETADVILGGLI